MASMDLVYPGVSCAFALCCMGARIAGLSRRDAQILLGNVNAARDLQGLQNAGVTVGCRAALSACLCAANRSQGRCSVAMLLYFAITIPLIRLSGMPRNLWSTPVLASIAACAQLRRCKLPVVLSAGQCVSSSLHSFGNSATLP